jgi:hypothetical protein
MPEKIIGYVRAGALIERDARDRAGQRLGRIADLVAEHDRDGRWRVTGVIVAKGPWGRLLGYEREQDTGPWLINAFARAVMHRKVRTIAWADLDRT